MRTVWEQELADWRGRVQLTNSRGEPPPPRPSPPDFSGEDAAAEDRMLQSQQLHVRRKQVLVHVRRKQVLVDIADEVEELARAAEAEMDAEDKRQALVAAVRKVRAAKDAADPNERPGHGLGLADRTQTVDVHTVLDAVSSRRRLLALKPVTVAMESVVPAGRWLPARRKARVREAPEG